MRNVYFWIRNWSHIATHLVVVVVVVLVLLVGRPSSKKSTAPSFEFIWGWNLAGMFFEYVEDTHRLTESVFDLTWHFQDGGHDVISRKKVLPPGECTRSVCSARHICSSVRQFLIRSTLVLVCLPGWRMIGLTESVRVMRSRVSLFVVCLLFCCIVLLLSVQCYV